MRAVEVKVWGTEIVEICGSKVEQRRELRSFKALPRNPLESERLLSFTYKREALQGPPWS